MSIQSEAVIIPMPTYHASRKLSHKSRSTYAPDKCATLLMALANELGELSAPLSTETTPDPSSLEGSLIMREIFDIGPQCGKIACETFLVAGKPLQGIWYTNNAGETIEIDPDLNRDRALTSHLGDFDTILRVNLAVLKLERMLLASVAAKALQF